MSDFAEVRNAMNEAAENFLQPTIDALLPRGHGMVIDAEALLDAAFAVAKPVVLAYKARGCCDHPTKHHGVETDRCLVPGCSCRGYRLVLAPCETCGSSRHADPTNTDAPREYGKACLSCLDGTILQALLEAKGVYRPWNSETAQPAGWFVPDE